MRTEWVGRNVDKDRLRNEIWTKLSEQNVAIGSPFNEIPNFVGSEEAASLLRQSSLWKNAKVVKCNPDNAQIPVRRMAIEDGKILYMAVPQLTDERCFVEITKESLEAKGKGAKDAETWQLGMENGSLLYFEEMQHIDIAVVGCVAVTKEGSRIGKGGGFADLEFGALRYYNLIDDSTAILTTVHDYSVVANNRIPIQKHDTFLNYIYTPTTFYKVETKRKQPSGIEWEMVQEDQLNEIPILRKLKELQLGKG